ncbi:DUF2637 domain-containing protein [Streptomyces sp. NPDC059611]|uniref:DUF2637 domain-containing protein n=1 Tax=Streptomyces sp. NPDC059611 TaxID=3346884 RepID=UPI0036975F2C
MPDTAIPATPTNRHRATWWDRFAIVLLGIAGCALSYDALRQMATAVHVRHQLTYLFPVVIDGFIAYGVRALLVLREAPMPARLYAWTLFITATAASIWANGLHALDLNRPGAVTLHLGDGTVTVLSAIAPLALAGATHLHILNHPLRRHHRRPDAGDRNSRRSSGRYANPGQAGRRSSVHRRRSPARDGTAPAASSRHPGRRNGALAFDGRTRLRLRARPRQRSGRHRRRARAGA